MYGESAPPADPYSEAYTAPAPAPDDAAPPPRSPIPASRGRSRSRSRSPGRANSRGKSPYSHKSPPPPRRPAHAPMAPNPTNVLGVFGLSIRTQERDLDEEFGRYGKVERVTIVYDQRSDRSRGFGFIKMATVEDATRCIAELNGVDLNGRRIRVDYSVTDRPHAPTPGEYMGHRRSERDSRDRRGGGRDRDYRDRDYPRRDRYDRDRDHHDRDRDRDNFGRDSRDKSWRDRRSPPGRGDSGRYSPEYRRRRSYSRSPPRGGSPAPRRDYD